MYDFDDFKKHYRVKREYKVARCPGVLWIRTIYIIKKYVQKWKEEENLMQEEEQVLH